MAHDKGHWTAQWGCRTGIGTPIQCPVLASDDFEYDVKIYVSGEFGAVEDAMSYAIDIAARLNATRSKS